MPQQDPEYYQVRAQTEREMAERATCDTARAAHIALAEKYERAAQGKRIELSIVERG
jgi:hypothetical protein